MVLNGRRVKEACERRREGGVRTLELSFFIERDLQYSKVCTVLDQFHHTSSDKQNRKERMHDKFKFKA